MYSVKAYVFNPQGVRIASATITTHDPVAFTAFRETPLAGVPEHCTVNVETFVNINGLRVSADRGDLNSMSRALAHASEELRDAARQYDRRNMTAVAAE